MSKRYFVFLIFASLLLSSPLWGQVQGAPFVLVTDFSGHRILSVNTTSFVVTPVFTLANSNFEGIVYGPEGTGFSGNKVYVCDPTADTIYRLNISFLASGLPSATPTLDTVYAGTGDLHNAQCGRFDSSGNFLVTRKTANALGAAGVWKFPGLGGSTCTTACPAPVQLISGNDAEGDLTHANNGDLLIVDIPNKSVLHSLAPFFPSASGLITSNLVQPTGGIARRNDGQIYVADGGGQNNIKNFGSDASFVGVCGTFSDVPQFIKIAADGTLYVATGSLTGNGSLNNGKLWSVNTTSCVTTLVADIGQSGNPPAIGVAIPPTSTSKSKPSFTGSQNFNFGFSQFVVSNALNPCTATVSESQTHLADIQTKIGTITNAPSGQTVTPVLFLGEAEFGTEFDLTKVSGCLNPPPFPFGNLFEFLIAGFTSGDTNPRIVECDSSTSGCQLGVDGFFPISEAIPGDGTYRKSGTGSTFFLANLGLDTTKLGQFCGFQNPLNDTLTNTTDPLNPAVPTASGNTLAIKFKIAKAGAACSSTKTSDFITDALEALSLIRVRDPQGGLQNDIVTPLSSTSTYVNPCATQAPPGSLTPVPTAICVENGNKQYSFSLNLNGLQSGVWNLSLTSLTNNIKVEWNFFRIK